MKELLEIYTGANFKIAEKFGLKSMWYGMRDFTSSEWYGDMSDVLYRGEDGEVYGFEVYGTSRWTSDCGEYTMYVGDDNGTKDFYIFLNDKMVDWLDS